MFTFQVVRKKQSFFRVIMATSIFVIYFAGEEKPDEPEVPDFKIVCSVRKEEKD